MEFELVLLLILFIIALYVYLIRAVYLCSKYNSIAVIY